MDKDTKLITKYRPDRLEDVIGQNAVVKSLRNVIDKKQSQCMLFTGNGGTGKTTLARIAASMAGCEPANIQDMDAATLGNADYIREMTGKMYYRPFGNGKRAVVVDECHSLSKAAWQALLKVTEEPPNWFWWFFCTTEAAKVPKAIVTRCAKFELRPVSTDDLWDLLTDIAKLEKFDASEDVLGLCAKQADGSPRQAISNLAICSHLTKRSEAAELLRSAVDSSEAHQLAKALVGGQRWAQIQPLLKALKDLDAESIRMVVQAYVTSCILSAKDESSASRFFHILDNFATPFPSHGGIAPVVAATARCVLRR